MPEPTHHELTDSDVRMRGFKQRTTVEVALNWLDRQTKTLDGVPLPVTDVADRILEHDIVSPVEVPGFERSMMDGYAVIATDTSGASVYNPLPLNVTGQSLPGNPTAEAVGKGQAIRIMTGAPLPVGADAVLPAEQSEWRDSQVWVQGEVSPGKNVGEAGEDISLGAKLFSSGRRLRPQDVGVLSSIGLDTVSVVRKTRVRIVVTGNELLPAGTTPSGFQITDANGPMLRALAERDGAMVTNPGIVPDNPEAILEALRDDADVTLVSGGSSVGQEDHAPLLVAQHGELTIHGIAMRPSSPAGMGCFEDRLVFLLPGNPVSCLCAYDFFAGRAIRSLGGYSKNWPYPRAKLPLRRKLVSTVGRVDYARVRIVDQTVEPLAISGASVLSSTTRADGFVIIPANSEGYPPETDVTVYFYDINYPR